MVYRTAGHVADDEVVAGLHLGGDVGASHRAGGHARAVAGVHAEGVTGVRLRLLGAGGEQHGRGGNRKDQGAHLYSPIRVL